MCRVTSNFIYATLKLAIFRVIPSTSTILNTVFKCKTIVPLVAFHLTLINTQVWVKDYVFTIYTCFREVLITVFYKSITKMYKSLNFEMSSKPVYDTGGYIVCLPVLGHETHLFQQL